MATIRVRFGCLLCLSSLSPFSSFFSRSFLFFLQSWGSLRTKRGLKPLWNTRCSPFTTLSLSSPSSSLCLSVSLSLSLAFCLSPSLSRAIRFSRPLHVFPDRNVLGACLLFRTAARLSGPRYLQLEYFLGACFSGPLHVFPDHNGYN